MTVAPPLSRSHLVPGLCASALLCASFACPVAAKPHADKAAPPGQAKKAAPGGHAKKAKRTPPGQAKKAARKAPRAQAPAAQAVRPAKAPKAAKGPKKPKNVKARGNPHRAPAAPVAPPATSGPPSATPSPGQARGRARARRRAAARARAAGHRATLARRARAARAERAARSAAGDGGSAAGAAATGTGPALAGGAAGSPEPEETTRPRANDGRPPFEPVIPRDQLPEPLRVVRDVVEVIPTPLRFLLVGLAALSVILAVAWALTFTRNRRLARQRSELLGEVGLLQAALLPDLPAGLSSCRASVAYRPADGPGAGGDFYDVISLAGGRTAVLIGDVSGHGRAALARTALARYTLRAYTEAGLEPREALQIAGAVLAGKLQGDFVTALVAVHDAAAGTLTFATAGHPPPIVVSPEPFDPVIVGTSPPLGVGSTTGQRQTTVPFPRGSVACFYTDGLSEAVTPDGRFGTARLERIVRDLGPEVTAKQVIAAVADSARRIADDAAACVIAAEDGSAIVRSRVERLEVSRAELRGPMPREFLAACGVSVHHIRAAEAEARHVARQTGGAVLEVRMGERAEVDVRATDLPVRDEDAADTVRRL